MKRLVLALVLLSGGVARAQQGGMPDPREMSGVPRPDQKLGSGVITVKLTRGELGRYAPAGSPVHLVGFHPDGTIQKLTAPVDAEGRATFRDLPTAGSVYYAYAVYNDDRLESQRIELPPEVGVALMLTGRKTDEAGAPVGDPIDDGVDEGFSPPGPGEVKIFLGGEIAPGQPVTLRELGGDAKWTAQAEPQGDRLVATFPSVPSGPDHVYLAETSHKGRVYRSAAFMLPSIRGAAKTIVVVERVLFGLQGGGSLDDERMWFELTLSIANLGGSPLDPGGDGLLLPLPKGFRSAEVKDDMKSRVDVVEGEGLRWKGSVPPGQHDVVVTFNLPVDEGAFSFDMEMPFGLQFAHLFLEKAPGARITAPGVAVDERESNGRKFFLFSNVNLEPGQTLHFEAAGFPMRPVEWKYAGWLVGLLVLGLVAWATAVAIRGAGRRPGPGTDATARHDLVRQRERLYDELVHLERRRAAGQIDDLEYERTRKTLVARLVVVHRELDAIEGAKGPHARASS